MSSGNLVILGGRLTRDPELRHTKTGQTIASFTLAHNHSKDNASFIDCNAWGEVGEMIENKKKKGDYLKVSGTLHQNTWQDKEGNNRSKVVVTVTELITTFVKKEEKSDGNYQKNTQAVKEVFQDNSVAKPSEHAPDDPYQSDSDIPF